jgi:hypothetical protein
VDGREVMKYRRVTFKDADYTPQGVLDYLFMKHPEHGYDNWIGSVRPKIIHIEYGYDGVAYVNIDGDPDQVTQASGSTGAMIFAMLVTFNLTEFEDIDSVYFVNEGDHLMRGEAGRLDFWSHMTEEEKLRHKEFLEDDLNAKNEEVDEEVEKLADIGDEKSIKALRDLKEQKESVGYAGCRMTEKQLDVFIDKAIRKIEQRLKKHKTDRDGKPEGKP